MPSNGASSARWPGMAEPERTDGPDGWRHHACGLTEVPEGDHWLTTPEAERIASFRFEKRRSETRMSRWTAKLTVGHALGLVDHDDADGRLDAVRRVQIRNAPTGAPEAFVDGEPAGVSISITDRADWAVCIVGSDPSVAIGCDLELVEPRSAAFVADWFTAAERAVVDAADPGSHDLLANLIWSAKESALKVLQTGLRRDTRSVEVRFVAEESLVAGWRAIDVVSLDPADGGAVFPGWWRRYGDFLLTCAAEQPLDPPDALVEPPPLVTATPTHAWLDGTG